MKRIIAVLLVLGSFAAIPPRSTETEGYVLCLAEFYDSQGYMHRCLMPVQVPYLHCTTHGGKTAPTEQ